MAVLASWPRGTWLRLAPSLVQNIFHYDFTLVYIQARDRVSQLISNKIHSNNTLNTTIGHLSVIVVKTDAAAY